MRTHTSPPKEDKNRSVANGTSGNSAVSHLVDNRPETILQKRLQQKADITSKARQKRAFQTMAKSNDKILESGKPTAQRLAFSASDNDLMVPNTYYNKVIPKITKQHPLVAQLPTNNQDNITVKKLYEATQTKSDFLNLAKAGLMLSEDIHTITPEANVDQLNSSANGSSDDETKIALEGALLSYRKVLDVSNGPFYGADHVQSSQSFGLLPSDYIPEADDLTGSVGKTLLVHKDSQQNLWWKYACRLIALVKLDSNYTKTKSVTNNQNINSLDGAVQALHEHYYNTSTKVMYDDTSVSTNIYPAWGYQLKFVGPASLGKLPNQTDLDSGNYIFDIDGHSVKVTVNQDIKKGDPEIQDDELDTYFTFDSDSRNYNRGTEKTKKVEYIWKK